MRKINLGCGFAKKEGYINIDSDKSVDPDIVRELERGLPFDDSSVDEVYAHHVLEHLKPEDFIFILSEIYRVCKNGAKIEIEVPLGVVDDPLHQTFFTETSFVHWCEPLEKKTGWRQNYYGGGMRFRELSKDVFPTPQMVMRLVLEVIK